LPFVWPRCVHALIDEPQQQVRVHPTSITGRLAQPAARRRDACILHPAVLLAWLLACGLWAAAGWNPALLFLPAAC
jgi:hypothetical protein